MVVPTGDHLFRTTKIEGAEADLKGNVVEVTLFHRTMAAKTLHESTNVGGGGGATLLPVGPSLSLTTI